ncbi:type II toxin-antitoxin system RatA family toxin [Kangiella spongicola]|jgi:ribosome-associated toxin RatA of RatAB toxin-antitoxin module|uniref:Ubiquinone-binding protein n=1 Tax=Kangiella spongicola TaxID=796379 RepID=A0A318D3C2_9GAMM|nr:type II toxin-antitoxin system RatA family toxin [Kangiella spongicola]MBV34554.1 ubiquinone-binding protein [Rickettsiales bacterium]PXF63796.1 ubiquinone-binding protein [Kangiella spongicola]
MKTVKRQALLPYSAQQMFELVNDVEKYPEFLPNCVGATEIERTETEVVASLAVAKGGFEKTFTTKNTNNPYDSIDMKLVDGPFKHLDGRWEFTSLDEKACKIELVVNFEFSNILTSMAFSSVFNHLAESFVEAFSKRAAEVYG